MNTFGIYYLTYFIVTTQLSNLCCAITCTPQDARTDCEIWEKFPDLHGGGGVLQPSYDGNLLECLLGCTQFDNGTYTCQAVDYDSSSKCWWFSFNTGSGTRYDFNVIATNINVDRWMLNTPSKESSGALDHCPPEVMVAFRKIAPTDTTGCIISAYRGYDGLPGAEMSSTSGLDFDGCTQSCLGDVMCDTYSHTPGGLCKLYNSTYSYKIYRSLTDILNTGSGPEYSYYRKKCSQTECVPWHVPTSTRICNVWENKGQATTSQVFLTEFRAGEYSTKINDCLSGCRKDVSNVTNDASPQECNTMIYDFAPLTNTLQFPYPWAAFRCAMTESTSTRSTIYNRWAFLRVGRYTCPTHTQESVINNNGDPLCLSKYADHTEVMGTGSCKASITTEAECQDMCVNSVEPDICYGYSWWPSRAGSHVCGSASCVHMLDYVNVNEMTNQAGATYAILDRSPC